LKIFKSKEHKSKLIKSRTRDLSHENLAIIAKKYKTKSDFKKCDSSAYSAASILGIIDQICSHMIPQNISRPQLILRFIVEKIFNTDKILYNTRKIIKPYELDIYLTEYKLAFEFDGIYWHKNKKDIDILKNKLCMNKNIKLIRIKENTLSNIINIKKQLINNLNEINNYCNVNIISNQINNITTDEILSYINDNIIDYNSIKDITNKYDNYKEFKINEKNLYCKLISIGKLKEFTCHMDKNIIYWDKELCKKEIDKYETFKDFYKKSFKCYVFIQRNNLYYLLEKYYDYPKYYIRGINDINMEYLNNIIDKLEIKTLENFRLHYENIYAYLVRIKKLYLLNDLKKKYIKHDISELLYHDYSNYKNLNDFKIENKALYSYMLRQNFTNFVKNKINNYD
jgi:very-short-patch-repair endonuclease